MPKSFVLLQLVDWKYLMKITYSSEISVSYRKSFVVYVSLSPLDYYDHSVNYNLRRSDLLIMSPKFRVFFNLPS